MADHRMKYYFEKAWLTPDQAGASDQRGEWQENVLVTVDADGTISSIQPGMSAPEQQKISGFALPAFANSHSHAFQRLLTGRTEYWKDGRDNFWSWRDMMYRVANRVTPDDMRHIAAFVYLEMVRAGYGAVAEFHYLHHQPSGLPYDMAAEMSFAIIEAAEMAGIALTHLPVLYQRGGFDDRLLAQDQQRFGLETDDFLKLVERVKGHPSPHQTGVAFHSLRAVPEEAIARVMAAIGPDMPVHIHIAEQVKEVEDCLSQTGQRPVDWLLSHAEVDRRWCLVHATHMTAQETRALARSGAVVSLCPSTEANLGDGFFPLAEFLAVGGRITIGSDSNSLIDPVEESRWLEYGARLKQQRRNITASDQCPDVGAALLMALGRGGAQALGQNIGAIRAGCRADIMVIDKHAPALCAVPDRHIQDALIFSGSRHDIRHVILAGKWCIRDRHHGQEDEIRANYEKTVRCLL